MNARTEEELHGCSRRSVWLPLLALLVCSTGVLLATVPGNRSEADDAFMFAGLVENGPFALLFRSRQLLYLPLMRSLYSGVLLVFPGLRAYPVLWGASLASGVLCLALVYLCLHCRWRMSAGAALSVAAMVGASYGFWRYACEAEIYMLANLGAIALYALAAGRRRSWLTSLATACLGALAVLVHVINAVPVFVGIPVLLVLRKRARYALLHVTVSAGLVWAAYSGAGMSIMPKAPAYQPPEGVKAGALDMFQPKRLAMAGAAFAHNVASANFLFTIPAVRDRLTRSYPDRFLEEEKLMGESAGDAVLVLPLVCIATIVIVLGGGGVVLLLRRRKGGFPPRRDGESGDDLRAARLSVATWLTITAGLTLWFEPGALEGWTMTLLPFWLLLGLVLFLPLQRTAGRGLAPLVAIALLVHNYAAGMSLVSGQESDYSYRKSRWLLENAGEGDLILTAGNAVFARYLAYESPATVIGVSGGDTADIMRTWRQSGETGQRVFVTGDVLAPPRTGRPLTAGEQAVVQVIATRVRRDYARVHSDEFGDVYLSPPAPPPVPSR